MPKQTLEQKYVKDRAYRKANREKLRAKRAGDTHARYVDLRGRAKRLGRKFRIAYATYDRMIKSGCHYCGADLMNEVGGSLDRVNNDNRNYTTQNVVPCCTRCNLVKSKFLSLDEMMFVAEMLRRLKTGDRDAIEICTATKRVKAQERETHLGRKSATSSRRKRRGTE